LSWVREAADRGAGELALIDPIYCGALMEKKGQQYKAFAAAAMDTTLPKLANKNLQGQVWATRLGQAARLVGTLALPEEGGEASDVEAVADGIDPAAAAIALETVQKLQKHLPPTGPSRP